jgi:hypothetical protein
MRRRIVHRFVETVPEDLDEGVVYVCLPYETVVHICCCGCGNEVVTPLHPLQWSVTFNGETISLSPSIGNWSFPCRSHYWIRTGEVRTARTFTDAEVAEVRAEDREALQSAYSTSDTSQSPRPAESCGWWAKLRRTLRRTRR